MEKLYIVVRRDLPDGDQAVQSGHALLQFAMEHKEETARWFEQSNTLAYLSVLDETALERLINRARDRGLLTSEFREPDLDNSLTAIALQPGYMSSRLCRGLPLTLGL